MNEKTDGEILKENKLASIDIKGTTNGDIEITYDKWGMFVDRLGTINALRKKDARITELEAELEEDNKLENALILKGKESVEKIIELQKELKDHMRIGSPQMELLFKAMESKEMEKLQKENADLKEGIEADERMIDDELDRARLEAKRETAHDILVYAKKEKYPFGIQEYIKKKHLTTSQEAADEKTIENLHEYYKKLIEERDETIEIQQNKIPDLMREIDGLKEQLKRKQGAKVTEVVQKLEEIADNRDEEIEELKKELSRAHREYSSLASNNRTLNEELEELRKENETAKQWAKIHAKGTQRRECYIIELGKQINELKQKIDCHYKETGKFQPEAEPYNCCYGADAFVVPELRRLNNDLEEHNERLEREIKKLKKENENRLPDTIKSLEDIAKRTRIETAKEIRNRLVEFLRETTGPIFARHKKGTDWSDFDKGILNCCVHLNGEIKWIESKFTEVGNHDR